MKVEVKVPVVKKEIRTGDMFVCGELFLILCRAGEKIRLLTLSGEGTWKSYDTQSQAMADIKVRIGNGEFTHYSREEFKLTLEKR